ncbi:hypothetical protein W59_38974 [Rhodococcus opacus RKJ300 = JCM 13270]|uniref:Uncharacterized protein n=1 Tax=Rhodococcus opacus RKJ300 = JCM 13270 TaxID=1165867 RepID=I0W5Z8_RHOOP|nr:hypothetical protein W59_38974 [Rhodococcus opacus RKJ300 = JCM 13270]
MFSQSPLHHHPRRDDSPAVPGYTAPRLAIGATAAATVTAAMISGSALITGAAELLVFLVVALASIPI